MPGKKSSYTSTQGYREEYKRSPLPYYAVGLLWIIWALFFPMYRIIDFSILIVLSFAAFAVVRKLAPDIKVKVPIIEEPVETGNEELDQIIENGKRYLSQIKEANAAIKDEYISQQILRMENTTDRIFKYIAKNPKQAPGIRKFMSYYLPTLLKLLNAYINLSSEGGSGANVSESMERIKNALSTIADAFDKQLDNLFMPEALDISTDIKVLEGILAQEGLKDDGIFKR
jgi:5-bromo-4-chloroindolyl phosphate hydrolysis protein